MKTIQTALVAALLAATAACGSPTGSLFVNTNNGRPTDPSTGTLTFTLTQSNDTRTPQAAVGGDNTLSFSGSVTTATPCWSVTATHTQNGNEIVVTVSAVPSGQTCPQIITFHNYQGTLRGLSAGTYGLTVVHDVSGSPTTAYDNPVVVR